MAKRQDLLRRVEVLSCVSGGSIIGAHYYLELQHLHQTKADCKIAASTMEWAQALGQDDPLYSSQTLWRHFPF